MSENASFNPIIATTAIPEAVESRLFTSKPDPSRGLDLHQSAASSIVLRRRGDTSTGGLSLLTGQGRDALRTAVESASHVYRVDRTPKALVWEHETASAGNNDTFRVAAVTMVSVADPLKIVERNVIDARMHLRAELLQRIEAACAAIPIGESEAAETALVKSLTTHTFDCGLRVDWMHAAIEPSPRSAVRLRDDQELDHQQDLERQRDDFQAKQNELNAERRKAQLKRDHDLETDRARLETVREQEQRKRERERRDYERELKEYEATKLKAKQDAELAAAAARAEEERKRDRQQQEHEAAQAQAELKAELEAETARAEQERDLEAERQKQQKAREEQENDLAKAKSQLEAELADAAADRERAKLKLQRDDANEINERIASHPAGMMGYLLALDDTTRVRDAIKVLEERQEAVWDRYRDLQKLETLSKHELRVLAIAIMRDPAGGAFGLPDGLPDLDGEGDSDDGASGDAEPDQTAG